jgi:hypothetical protein
MAVILGDPIHGDGIFQCRGCRRLYAEYINGCPNPVHDDGGERKVVLVIPDG